MIDDPAITLNLAQARTPSKPAAKKSAAGTVGTVLVDRHHSMRDGDSTIVPLETEKPISVLQQPARKRAKKNIAAAPGWHQDDSEDEYEVESIVIGDCVTAVWAPDAYDLDSVHLDDIVNFGDLRAQSANYYRATVSAINSEGE